MLRLTVLGLCLLVALPSSSLADPLSELVRADLSPAARDKLVEQVCASPERPSPEEVSVLLRSAAPRPVQIDGARLAVCLADPALIPLMYGAFHRGRAAEQANDPDVYERLLRGLQAFPLSTLRAALEDSERGLGGAVHQELGRLAWDRLRHDWLEPLGGGMAPREIPAEVGGERVLTEAARWLDAVLAMGPDGLVRLQTDSGDHAYLFHKRLQGWHLAALIEHGEPEVARLAVEVCRQSGLCDGAAHDALAARLKAHPDDVVGALADLPAWRDDPQESAMPLRPVVPRSAPPQDAEQIIEPAPRWPIASLAVLGLVLAWGLWVGAVRLRPASRVGLFSLGAVMIAPSGLVLAELGLAAGGVRPLAQLGGAGWSEPQALRGVEEGGGLLLTPATLSGEPYFVTAADGARWSALLQDPGDTWRIATLGESSVHASNHLKEESFAEVLGVRLRLRNPGRTIEVLNGGIGGAFSDDIYRAGQDALAAGADILVLYHGVNDLGRLEDLAGMRAFSPWQLGVRVLLDESRLARVIHDLLPAAASEPEPEPEGAWRDGAPIDEAAADRLVRLSALRCSRNQQRLVHDAQALGVPVVVVAQALVTTENYPPATRQKRLLRWLAEETASRTGVPLLDAAMVWGQHSRARGGPTEPDEAYFWDQLHPSRLGHAVLGEALAPTVERLLLEAEASPAD